MEWLFQVKQSHKFHVTTLVMSERIIDTCLRSEEFFTDEFQLLGIASLWISVKFDECKILKVQRITDLCKSTYTKKEVVAMEHRILIILNFDLCKFYGPQN